MLLTQTQAKIQDQVRRKIQSQYPVYLIKIQWLPLKHATRKLFHFKTRLDSGGIKGDLPPPPSEASPTPPPPSEEKIVKISHFWQSFGFLPPQNRILPPWCPTKKFWCSHCGSHHLCYLFSRYPWQELHLQIPQLIQRINDQHFMSQIKMFFFSEYGAWRFLIHCLNFTVLPSNWLLGKTHPKEIFQWLVLALSRLFQTSPVLEYDVNG